MQNRGDFQRFNQIAYARDGILGPAWAEENQQFAKSSVGFALNIV
jgi:hypothetical protein